jgi:ComEC/Rec2-related protein
MNLSTLVFTCVICATSFLFGRFYSTSITIPKGLNSFRGVVQTVSIPEYSESFITYPVKITHLLQTSATYHNLQYSVNLKLRLARTSPELSPGSIVLVQGLITESQKIIPFRLEYIDHRSSLLSSTLYRFRKAFEAKLNILLPPEQSKLALGMAIGSSSQFRQDIYTAMRNSGTLHMVVVSGSNIAILVKFSLLFLQRLVSQKKSLIVTCFLISFYVILSGGHPPILRAAVMGILSLGAQFFGRTSISLWTLFLSVIILAIFQPQILTSISFQLSVFATLGICVLTPAFDQISSKGKGIQFSPKQEFATVIAAQAGVAPLLVYYFQEFSVIAVVTNLLVSWTVAPIIVLSSLAGCLALLNLEFARYLIFLPEILTAYFLNINLFISNLPITVIHTKQTNIVFTVGLYLLISSIIAKKVVQQNYPEDKK